VNQRLERDIEALMESRLGRPCLFLPSGRLALFLALQMSLKPPGRVLMSPVTDDVIFFTVLAAGLRPVMAPLSAEDGNIEPDLVSDDVWSSLDAVLTTNLYGLPDRALDLRSRCDGLGIPLIEDAAHAIQTLVDGRRVGTFGEVAAFSFSKQVDAACGGVLAFTDEAERTELEALRDRASAPDESRERQIRVAAVYAEALVVGLHLIWPARWLKRRLGLTERRAYRMPLREAELQQALSAGAGLRALHSWMRVDRHDYRVRPSRIMLERVLQRLRRLDADGARRVEGVERLRALPMVAPAVRSGDPQPLFRVPLLVQDRAALIAKLERRIRSVGYIFDPPLDEYAGAALAEPSPAPEVARAWASQVFPADPLDAAEIMRSVRD
jgi:dTDP-4-amino-4,6-dideoxygalactose transaminase